MIALRHAIKSMARSLTVTTSHTAHCCVHHLMKHTHTHTCQDCILNAFFGIKNVSVLGASSFVDFGLEVVVNEICRLDPTERVMWFSFKTNTGGFSVVI